MQTKLHRWAAADPGRRFDDLFNFVYDPATLQVAWLRVAGNTGAQTAGVDGMRAADLGEYPGGLQGFLDDLRVRAQGRVVPSGAGAATEDPQTRRVGETAQSGDPDDHRPGGPGRAEAGAGTHLRGRLPAGLLRVPAQPAGPRRDRRDPPLRHQGYRWVLDADIEACFDRIDHTALLDRVRRRVKDKRVVALVKAFLKAGLLTELGEQQDTHTGTPQGGILSPLLANIALSSAR